MNKVTKRWYTVGGEGYRRLILSVDAEPSVVYIQNIDGASPAYVEELVERLNIHINNLLYELRRIPR